jgi:hypothetical protein
MNRFLAPLAAFIALTAVASTVTAEPRTLAAVATVEGLQQQLNPSPFQPATQFTGDHT